MDQGIANPCPSHLSFKGINHIKLAVSSLRKSLDFYTKVLPFTHIEKFNHYTPEHNLFAYMLFHEPSKLLVELRYNPKQAAAQKCWDPVTFGVSTRQDLVNWSKVLDERGARHSPVLMGIKSWVLAIEDPDGKMVRLYVEDEEHEWTDNPDADEEWLGVNVADPDMIGA